jgi:hypothetical protein
VFHQQIDNPADAHLFRFGEAPKPIGEFIDTLDFPCQIRS